MITTGIQEKTLDKEILRRITEQDSILDKKNILQSYAVDISKTTDHLVLSWGTGCGKSLAAIKIIKEAIDSGDKTPWYIVCAEIAHVQNWISEFVKHKLGYLMEYVEIFCYASLNKYKNLTANLILDESHSVSDLRLKYLNTIKANKIISLSATLNPDRKNQLNSLRKFKEIEVTMTDAINCGILPSPRIFVVYDKLRNDPQIRTYSYFKNKGSFTKNGRGISIPTFTVNYDKHLQWMKDNKNLQSYSLEINCTQQEYYNLLSSQIDYYSKQYKVTGQMWAKNKMLRVGNDRKTFVANSKNEILCELQSSLIRHTIRSITFTGSIEQCNLIGGPSRSIHSKVPGKIAKDTLDAFNSKNINHIYAVQMLREGINLEDIQAGIITQLDSEELSFIQMMGEYFALIPLIR